MADVTALISNSECQVEQGASYDAASDVVRKHPEWFTAAPAEPESEPEVAPEAPEPEPVPEPVGEQPEEPPVDA